jgi:hypothetical protein
MENDNMQVITETTAAPAVRRCPVAHGKSPAETVQGQHRLPLFTASQVDQLGATLEPLATTLAWVRSFLARPNPNLGRTGPVCPYVPTALELDTIWCGLVRGQADAAQLQAAIGEYRELFLSLEPRQLPEAMNKAILIVFPDLGANGESVVDEVQRQLKPRFVEAGLMLGEFHASNGSPGLRNPDFRPLRSPIPMLAIRHMVETDLPFLCRSLDPPAVRASFIRSYLRRMGTTVSRNSFGAAIEELVNAEIEVRRALPEGVPVLVAERI